MSDSINYNYEKAATIWIIVFVAILLVVVGIFIYAIVKAQNPQQNITEFELE